MIGDRPFDEGELMARKSNHCGYRYCPLCGDRLVREMIDGRDRMRCKRADCGFIFYQNPIPASGALVIRGKELLLVKRAHPPRVGWWCLPAGFMEWNEHPSQTAVRELKEETGLNVELGELLGVYSGNDDPRTNAVLVLYLARDVGATLKPADDALEARYFRLDALPDKIAFVSHRQAIADYLKLLDQIY